MKGIQTRLVIVASVDFNTDLPKSCRLIKSATPLLNVVKTIVAMSFPTTEYTYRLSVQAVIAVPDSIADLTAVTQGQ